jgi:hypothetical protein
MRNINTTSSLSSEASSGASTEDFFTRLPVMGDFGDVTDAKCFQPAPKDWHVVITDVVNSTGAIESGNYQSVNILGATTIVALLNVAGSIEIPFVFGGDGASFLIPPSLIESARKALAAAKIRAQEAFNLELRAGIVPVKKIASDGHAIQIAKLKVSDHFAQAVFAGGGMSHAERLIKRPPAGELYELSCDGTLGDADLTGLQCRWNPIPSPKGETVSMLIQSRLGEIRTRKSSKPIARSFMKFAPHSVIGRTITLSLGNNWNFPAVRVN